MTASSMGYEAASATKLQLRQIKLSNPQSPKMLDTLCQRIEDS